MTRPTVSAIMLGRQLRKLRESKGLSQEQAAKLCDWPESKLSKIENGKQGISMFDVHGLCGVYGTSDELKNELQRMAAAAKQAGWWDPYSALMLKDFSVLLQFDQLCTEVLIYESELVTGLLQTEAYARHLHSKQDEMDEAAVQESIDMRMRRQRDFWSRTEQPTVKILMWETALRSNACDRKQRELLKARGSLPSVEIRVLPIADGPYPRLRGPFSVLRFDNPVLPDVVYTESIRKGSYDDRQEAVDDHARVFGRTFEMGVSLKEF